MDGTATDALSTVYMERTIIQASPAESPNNHVFSETSLCRRFAQTQLAVILFNNNEALNSFHN